MFFFKIASGQYLHTLYDKLNLKGYNNLGLPLSLLPSAPSSACGAGPSVSSTATSFKVRPGAGMAVQQRGHPWGGGGGGQ